MDVPVIDLGGGDPEAVSAIAAACVNWGFFQVVGHGVDALLIDSAMSLARDLFASPPLVKRGLFRTAENPWGYYDRELTKNLRDKKEIFDIGPDARQDSDGRSLWCAGTPWPADRPEFRRAMLAYREACEALSRRLLELVGLGLGVEPGVMEGAFKPASTSFLRLNYYPVGDPLGEQAVSAPPGADLGIHHHTDAGALTVISQDAVEGLQVWRQGDWRTVRPAPGALVVNIGDMVQVWSNDLYRAPVHRVLAMEASDRLSLAHFFNPGYGANVEPLTACVGPGGEPRYRSINWGEFRQRRAQGDFADYGAEVQISDYRLV